MIETTVVGSYPKPPPEGQGFEVRKALHALERGEVDASEVEAARDRLVTEIIREQEAAGIDIVTDGHARWDDLLTPFARNMAGMEIGGLLRWFDNNVYYRRPVCTGAIEWRGPSSVDGFQRAVEVATVPVKAVIPGPVTFARLSVDEHYGDHSEFVMAIARVLAQEAFELDAHGARHIQIDEPALLTAPEDLELARSALGVIVDECGEAETTMATYFGDAKRLGEDLFTLPVHRYALDLVAGPENLELLRGLPEDKSLQAGIVNSRNTRLEDKSSLSEQVEQLAGLVGADRLRISPSAGLEFLPREKARLKLELLAEVGKEGA